MLDGEEKGLLYYVYNNSLTKKDFENFDILDLHKDSGDHLCLLGKLKDISRS